MALLRRRDPWRGHGDATWGELGVWLGVLAVCVLLLAWGQSCSKADCLEAGGQWEPVGGRAHCDMPEPPR